MTKSEIRALVISVIKDVQKTSGREWSDINGETVPIGALDGFDSLAGMEATALIEEQLRQLMGLDSLGDDSVFVANKRALTLDEVCEKIISALSGVA